MFHRAWTSACRAGQSVLRAALDLVLPPQCVACGADLPQRHQGPLVCEACRQALLRPVPAACPRCGAGTALPVLGRRCARCRHLEFRFAAAVALGEYADALREAVLRTKWVYHEPLALALASLLWECQGPTLRQWQPEAVVPIPMHWRRRWLRGTNTPERIADVLGAHLKVPAVPLLRRVRPTRPQSDLSRMARMVNVRGAFRLRRGYDCRGARLLLVDDILTTGATCNAAASVLRAAKAATVCVAVIARAEGPA
jgi:ComF family protein